MDSLPGRYEVCCSACSFSARLLRAGRYRRYIVHNRGDALIKHRASGGMFVIKGDHIFGHVRANEPAASPFVAQVGDLRNISRVFPPFRRSPECGIRRE